MCAEAEAIKSFHLEMGLEHPLNPRAVRTSFKSAEVLGASDAGIGVSCPGAATALTLHLHSFVVTEAPPPPAGAAGGGGARASGRGVAGDVEAGDPVWFALGSHDRCKAVPGWITSSGNYNTSSRSGAAAMDTTLTGSRSSSSTTGGGGSTTKLSYGVLLWEPLPGAAAAAAGGGGAAAAGDADHMQMDGVVWRGSGGKGGQPLMEWPAWVNDDQKEPELVSGSPAVYKVERVTAILTSI